MGAAYVVDSTPTGEMKTCDVRQWKERMKASHSKNEKETPPLNKCGC